jgi:uncharacterized cupredoxin-like copper-binding protein
MHIRSIVLGSILALSAGTAWSHGDSPEKKAAAKPAQSNAEEHAFGRAGDPKKVSRTIQVGMDDTMHFTPGDLAVKRGETIRFVVLNNGKVMHEMVIGTMKELKEHAELMRKFPNMEHDEPYMAHVAPGKREEIVWQFTRAGEFHYACLIPGHLEAGMIAKITVK